MIWSDRLLGEPGRLRGGVVYDRGSTPLYRAALWAEAGVAAAIMAGGGRSHHPLLLLAEAGVPALAGAGELSFGEAPVTVDSVQDTVLAGAAEPPSVTPASSTTEPAPVGRDTAVYVNVGYPTALREAASLGADGIGLLRTEFAVAKMLAGASSDTGSAGPRYRELLSASCEADVVYRIAEDAEERGRLIEAFQSVLIEAVELFGRREIFVRTLDLPREDEGPLGNRGIRRDVASGGHLLATLAEAVARVVESKPNASIGVILPLVSHYSQIHFAMARLTEAGLTLRGAGPSRGAIQFGWEIEQPAAALKNGLWLEAFELEHARPPDVVGIGTNDLTQFTIALGRDAAVGEHDRAARDYLASLYSERDFAVVLQIVQVARDCRRRGARTFLLGQAGADPVFVSLTAALGITPSVGLERVGEVRRRLASRRETSWESAAREYVAQAVAEYPPNVAKTLAEAMWRSLDNAWRGNAS